MTVRTYEFTQYEFNRPGRSLYRYRGDISDLSALIPDTYGNLKRLPGWADAKALKAGVATIRGAFFDDANNRHVFIGVDNAGTPTKVTCFYYSWEWSTLSASAYDLTATPTGLGGKHMHNVAYWGGDLYIIGDDGDVYRGSDYTAGLASFYATSDALLLAPSGDRMYMVTTGGTVYRLNDADNAFEAHYTPIGALDVQALIPYRGYLALFARGDDGTLYIYRLPDRGTITPHNLAQIGKVEFATGDIPTYGLLFAAFDDKIYFSPGRVKALPNTHKTVMEIFEFNGSQINRIAQITNSPYTHETVGLIPWREQLIFYALNDGGLLQDIKILVGDFFTDFTGFVTAAKADYIPLIASLNGELIITGYASSTEYIYHAGYHTKLADGYVVSSRIDMGNPGKEKRLESITALLNDHNTDFKIVIKYRVNDATSWTTASTANGTRRANISDLGVSFYTLQLRIDLDDNTTNGREDNRIEAISVRYTEAE